jgi:hypothetical protein
MGCLKNILSLLQNGIDAVLQQNNPIYWHRVVQEHFWTALCIDLLI